MTLRSLEIFTEVVKLESMNKAANALHISQPTISQAVMELEREYGVKLFDRLSKKLYITDAGRKLHAYALSLLDISHDMSLTMQNLSVRQKIRVGATITVGKCLLVDLVRDFERLHADTTMQVTIDNTAIIEALLLESKIDVALVEGNIRSNDLVVEPLYDDMLVLAAHPEHPLAQRQSVTLHDIVEYPFILREVGSGTREDFEHALMKANLSIDVKWNCHGFDSILEALLANQGLTVISQRIVAPYVDKHQLSIIPIEDVAMKRHFSVVYHKDKYLSPGLERLLVFIEQDARANTDTK